MLDLDSDVASTRMELAESKRIAGVLEQHYPNHLWAVNVDARNGIATVHNMGLSGEWGFYIRLKELVNDPFMRKVVHAGGELLERYRVSRGQARQDELDNVPVDFFGRRIADTTK